MFFNRLVLIIYFIFSVCFSQGKVDGVAAIVGKNVVLHSDVLQQAQFVAMDQQIDPSKNPYLFEKIYLSTLNNIINQYAVLDVAAKDTNIVVSNDEVDRALSQQIDDFIIKAGSEELFLEMAGMSMRQLKADYWQDIRDMMIVERFQYSKRQEPTGVHHQLPHKNIHHVKNSTNCSGKDVSWPQNMQIFLLPGFVWLS